MNMRIDLTGSRNSGNLAHFHSCGALDAESVAGMREIPEASLAKETAHNFNKPQAHHYFISYFLFFTSVDLVNAYSARTEGRESVTIKSLANQSRAPALTAYPMPLTITCKSVVGFSELSKPRGCIYGIAGAQNMHVDAIHRLLLALRCALAFGNMHIKLAFKYFSQAIYLEINNLARQLNDSSYSD